MGNEELEQEETQNTVPEKFSYSLKFSPKLYNSNGTLKSPIEFKDSYEFSVKYNAEVTNEYFNWTKTHYVGPDGLPLYEKKNEIPVNVTNKYLFRASLEEVNFTPVNNSTVTEGVTEGSGEGNSSTTTVTEGDDEGNSSTTTVTEGDDEEGAGTGNGVVTDDENPSSDTITDTGIKYVLEKNGYKITQPSNGNFVVTSDGTATEDQKIYIYMIDPHTELYGTDEAYEPVEVDDVNYYGTYETDGSRRRKINKSTDKVNVDVLKNPTELDEKILEAELTFNGTALPEYTANVVTYEDADLREDDELVMTLADGFTTDDIEVYTYPFSLNLVADTVEETVDEETVTKSVYKSDLNAVRPGIYQVYAVYKGRRLKLRDLIIKGDNILNPNMKLQSEETTVEETTTTTYFYNLEVGESILLSLYSNPIKDSKDVRLYKDGADNPAVDLKMLPNSPGCNPSAVLRVSEFVSDPITIKAINTLQPPSNESEEGPVNLAARIIKVIPIPQDKHYTAPVAIPDTDKIKFFDEIVDIYRYADGRRVFSTNFGDDKNPVILYQIVTNEYEEDTEFAFEYAMLVNEFVRYSHTS